MSWSLSPIEGDFAAMLLCPFCRIPAGNPDEIIAANEFCYLIEHAEGALAHGMMIIPFRHIETPFDLSPEEWAAIQPLMLVAHNQLMDSAPDGFNLGWNVGRTGGQEVDHVHLHVFARFADEPFAGRGIRRWFKSEENRRPA